MQNKIIPKNYYFRNKFKKKICMYKFKAASACSSVGASPTGSTGHQTDTLSVKSAGASPPQSNDNHLGLGNMFRAGGSLPNVNNNNNDNNSKQVQHLIPVNTANVHTIDIKVPFISQIFYSMFFFYVFFSYSYFNVVLIESMVNVFILACSIIDYF